MANLSRTKSTFAAFAVAFGILTLGNVPCVEASDHTVSSKQWEFDSAQSGTEFAASLASRSKEGYKIVDHESYRVGRTPRTSTVWVKKDKKDKFIFESGMSIATLKKSHKAHHQNGYVITEIEAVRNGMSLELAASWEKRDGQPNTLFYWGMDHLLFSNRYGEMADRGYRIVDFEAYESSGQILCAAIWVPKEGADVRFFRGLDEVKFGALSSRMQELGFRIVDLESYLYQNELLFAAAWEKSERGVESVYDYNLLADAFYERNAKLLSEGYRLIDFETYNKSVSELRYAASWVKESKSAAEEKEKDSFIDSFRNAK